MRMCQVKTETNIILKFGRNLCEIADSMKEFQNKIYLNSTSGGIISLMFTSNATCLEVLQLNLSAFT